MRYVLVTENGGKTKEKGQKCRDRSISKSRSKYKDVECHYFGKKGHIKRYYFKWKSERKNDSISETKEDGGCDRVAITTSKDLFVVYDKGTINYTSQDIDWVVDPGATIHVTAKKEFFFSYTPYDYEILRMDNDSLSKVIDIGNIFLRTNNCSQLLLRDVRHAPDIRMNLISDGRFDKNS